MEETVHKNVIIGYGKKYKKEEDRHFAGPHFFSKTCQSTLCISVRFPENSNQFPRCPGKILVSGVCDEHPAAAYIRIRKIKRRRVGKVTVSKAAFGNKGHTDTALGKCQRCHGLPGCYYPVRPASVACKQSLHLTADVLVRLQHNEGLPAKAGKLLPGKRLFLPVGLRRSFALRQLFNGNCLALQLPVNLPRLRNSQKNILLQQLLVDKSLRLVINRSNEQIQHTLLSHGYKLRNPAVNY